MKSHQRIEANPFEYHNLAKITEKDPVHHQNYLAGRSRYLGDSFITFVCEDEATIPVDHSQGLKFHISLPEDNQEQYAKAWNLIKDILIRHRVRYFKIVDENTKMSMGDGSQRGKDVTIFAQYNPEKSIGAWQELLQEITETLQQNNITPGYRPINSGHRADEPITGSNYISYRYENGAPEVDAVADIRVSVPHQLPPKEWGLSNELNLIKLRLMKHNYVLNGGGVSIDGKKYSASAATILKELELALKSNIDETKALSIIHKIKNELNGKTTATSRFFFNYGARDLSTAKLYKDILNYANTIEGKLTAKNQKLYGFSI